MSATPLYRRTGLLLLPIALLYAAIYFQTFTADYVYLDEGHQVWYNGKNVNLFQYLTQGRWLAGLMFENIIRSFPTIESMKGLRLLTLGGWVLTTWLWVIVFTRWARLLDLSPYTYWLGNLFVICSASVAICIGWFSCLQMVPATALALLAGHVLFTALLRQDEGRSLPGASIAAALVLGVGSLLFYQTSYGAFLLPFFFYFVKGRKPDRTLWISLGVYFATYVVYYLVFQLSLQVYGVPPSDRTGITLNVLRKIGFFFSGPVPQAFSLNVLYSSSSVLSQALYILVFASWVVSAFRRAKDQPVGRRLLYIAIVLVLLALIYLPLMIAKENFSSYRSLFAVNLAVFILVMEELFTSLRKERTSRIVAIALAVALFFTGFYNFNQQFINPVRKEYAAISQYIRQHYTADKLTVHFIRADRKLFSELYGVMVAKDEFGAPSASRDWVPEPLVRQLLFEMTGSRQAAEQVRIVQYDNREQYAGAGAAADDKSLVVDVNELLRNAEGRK